MAMYSAKEMKEKMSGKSKVREMELKEGKQMKLWIPKNEFMSVKKHFNIQSIPRFKNSLVRAITCINSDSNIGTCPICDHIKELWDKWRDTQDKAERQKLQAIINRLNTTFYYVNAVDVSDKSYKCMSLRLTPAMFKAISDVINPDDGDDVDISHVLWTIKKGSQNNITRYAIVEDVDNETALKLSKNIDKICNRDEKDGGYIDLDKAYSQTFSQSEYMHKLYGGDDSDEDESDILDDEPKQSSAKKKQSVKIEDEEVSLDDIEEETKPAPKKTSKTKSEAEDELDDDLDLDSDDDVKPASKKPSKTKSEAEDELDDDLDLDSDDDVKPAPKKQPKAESSKKSNIDDDDLDLEDIEF